ncbi:glucosaminidase domain-containing protein [Terrimonas sp. NA20]|uniref:Glucosaminidase domain-containing protein n=1 Tax=Terrimonas ginsenosidimutans TaxID=2908004 RepID=A0ABS9KL96_9BACT|nr:glucosaminidase domain-containing protein [Terrimonas ginsenosidimutans]MCG2613085.1 glucosaminidase domain-containing protein [Terrimonas ginsenosidimutans]
MTPAKNILTNACRSKRALPVLLMLLLLNCQVQAQSKYVKKYRQLADSLSAIYEIPASIILGVAIVESGGGNSRNAKLLHNHFGIVGKNNLLKTKGIKSRYKQYSNVAASYDDFCKLLSRRKFYQTLKGKTDYHLWTEAISKTGYSEAPAEWKKRINATIRKNKLATAPRKES